jgi:hypothetical protein
VGGNNPLGEGRLSFISLNIGDLLLCDAVEERSLLSILRSELLTTLVNNDVSGKVNSVGRARALDKFDTMQTCFAS